MRFVKHQSCWLSRYGWPIRLNHHRSGAGPAMVLIHGIGHHWQGWAPVIELLAPEREVIALDLPGFGASPMPPPGTPPGIEALTSLVAEFIDELGLERPHVAGNSLGGWIALELARRDRVRSATALSPAGFHNQLEGIYQRISLRLARGAARLMDGRADRLLTRPRVRRLAFGQMVARPERIPAGELVPSVHALASASWFDPTLMSIIRDGYSERGSIPVPVTIAWGEQDRLLRPHQSRRAARAIPSARIVTLRGCGHVPFSDDPQQVAEVLLEGSRT